ncbi:hypothetical protein [Bifidobacterium sp.]|jgi:hypothetical protein|uniref:hypothetical protein n=1 Tax=Bifidobacterium sp. TaxID=41200 RepID=UPI0025BDFDF5|nr:hypothetical protein [Bifidobacterium sp.]MCH4208972.1 hypothetical protein [Bifidobacterium sp.]MCI1224945.1 hypothetical protein [Bifidobacterium sp.]
MPLFLCDWEVNQHNANELVHLHEPLSDKINNQLFVRELFGHINNLSLACVLSGQIELAAKVLSFRLPISKAVASHAPVLSDYAIESFINYCRLLSRLDSNTAAAIFERLFQFSSGASDVTWIENMVPFKYESLTSQMQKQVRYVLCIATVWDGLRCQSVRGDYIAKKWSEQCLIKMPKIVYGGCFFPLEFLSDHGAPNSIWKDRNALQKPTGTEMMFLERCHMLWLRRIHNSLQMKEVQETKSILKSQRFIFSNSNTPLIWTTFLDLLTLDERGGLQIADRSVRALISQGRYASARRIASLACEIYGRKATQALRVRSNPPARYDTLSRSYQLLGSRIYDCVDRLAHAGLV